ncbi:MAG: efflux RND transporter periplasmic adaptor subunit [Elusimicrobiota bacterium]
MVSRQWTTKMKTIAAVAAIALLGAVGFKKYNGQKDPEGAAPVTVDRGDIELHFVDSGELTPKVYVDIASKVSGRVIDMSVEEGARVKKGDKLCTIQPGRTEAEAYVPTSLQAPIPGVVMRYQNRSANNPEEGKISKLGDYITGMMDSNTPTYILTVADLSKLVVKMKISEMDVLKLHEGMNVDVKVDALPAEKYPARVTLVAPQAEKDNNNLKNFKVEVTLLKLDSRLKPGMTARVDGLLDVRRKVLKLPLSAVFEEAGKEWVYVDAKPKARRVELKLGLRSETDAELLSGPKEGEKLLTEKPADKTPS